jgi:hypothetical protein
MGEFSPPGRIGWRDSLPLDSRPYCVTCIASRTVPGAAMLLATLRRIAFTASMVACVAHICFEPVIISE